MIEPGSLSESFAQRYAGKPRIFSAPGRVNLIGEHTDYNDGFVLPLAIDRRTYVAASPRADRQIHAHSNNFDQTALFDPEATTGQKAPGWSSYVFGVAAILEQQGIVLSGADLLIQSDVPVGGGLSSSAALEVAAGSALLGVSGKKIGATELALAAQQAEHDFVGTKCGIMDQLTATIAQAEHALLIDCRSLKAKPIPLATLPATFVVCNTRIKHQLASSAYNERRRECESAVAILTTRLPGVNALRDVSLDDFLQVMSALPDTLRRRSRHIITENARTLSASEALESGDAESLGALMKASHESLRLDYEVSCVELDVMVELANQHQGVFGARMTGGGFGGCTISLVERNAVEDFCSYLQRRYQEKVGVRPDVYVVRADSGVREELVTARII